MIGVVSEYPSYLDRLGNETREVVEGHIKRRWCVYYLCTVSPRLAEKIGGEVRVCIQISFSEKFTDEIDDDVVHSSQLTLDSALKFVGKRLSVLSYDPCHKIT